MAPKLDTNVHFVLYQPSGSSKAQQFLPIGKNVSQQRHAALEYHRKVKSRRSVKVGSIGSVRNHGSSTMQDSLDNRTSFPVSPILLPSDGKYSTKVNDDSLSLTDVGVGRLDPFNVAITSELPPYVIEMLDHAISYQWPIFSSSKTVGAVANIKYAVLACAAHSLASLHTIVFAGATHNAYSHIGMDVSAENKMLRLAYKVRAIQELNTEIQNLQGDPSDELLLCIITLAAHGSGEQLSPPEKSAYVSPLSTAQNFHYYGSMKWETAHLEAIRLLIRKKGGLHKVQMSGLANAIALADIFVSFQNLSVPAFPLLAPTSLLMSTWPPPPSSLPGSLSSLTTGFSSLPTTVTSTPLFTLIDIIRLITIGYDMYIRKHDSAPSLVRILWARNSVQHDLLSINTVFNPQLVRYHPHRNAVQPEHLDVNTEPYQIEKAIPFLNQSLYDLVRLSTLAYMLLVLFPLPPLAGVHAELSKRLMSAVDTCTVLDLWEQYPTLLFWSTVLGGAIADETTSPWFAKTLVTFQRGQPERSLDQGQFGDVISWSVAKQICAAFLWFDGLECDMPGKAFWDDHVKVILPTSSKLNR